MAHTVLVSLLVLLSTSSAWANPLRAGLAVSWQRGQKGGFSALFRVEMPLERLAEPRPSLTEGPPPKGDTSAQSDADPESPRPSAAPRRIAARRLFRIHSELARAVVREALRVHGASRAQQRLDGLASRSRAASLLPELMLRGARSTDQSLRLAPTGTDRYDLTQTGGADLLFEARATWDLDRLIFASEEIRVEHLRLDHAQSTEKLALLVLRHLFSWQRARGRLLSEELDAEGSLGLELDILEAETALDVLTDGFFAKVRARWTALQPGYVSPLAPGPGQEKPRSQLPSARSAEPSRKLFFGDLRKTG